MWIELRNMARLLYKKTRHLVDWSASAALRAELRQIEPYAVRLESVRLERKSTVLRFHTIQIITKIDRCIKRPLFNIRIGGLCFLIMGCFRKGYFRIHRKIEFTFSYSRTRSSSDRNSYPDFLASRMKSGNASALSGDTVCIRISAPG